MFPSFVDLAKHCSRCWSVVRFHPASNTIGFVQDLFKTAVLTVLKRYQAQYVSIFGELY